MTTTAHDAVARAEALAAGGDVTAAVASLVAAGLVEQAGATLDAALDDLAARWDHVGIRSAVGALPPAHRSLAARLALADVDLSAGATRTGDLQDLLEEAAASGDPALAGHAAAVLAEHLLVHADPSGVFLAASRLTELPAEPLQRTGVLVARARLRRVTLAARVILAPAETAESSAEHVACLEDYRRAGRHTDRWLTTAMIRGLRALGTWAAGPGDRHAVLEARDQLLAMRSAQVTWVRWVVAVLASLDDDPVALRAELTAMLREDSGTHAFPIVMTRHLDAMHRLLDAPDDAARDDAVRRLEDLLATVRQDYPLFVGSLLVMTTHALLDVHRAQDATVWFGRFGAYPVFMPHEEHEREILRCRLALAVAARDGAPPDDVADRLGTALDGLVLHGTTTMAAGLALRTAATARTAGADSLADTLVTRAEALLPPSSQRHGTLRRWLDAARPQDPASGGARHALRLLAPDTGIAVDGSDRRPPPAVVRLLAVLAAAGRPVGTEQLADLLWPDADPVAARGRLKSTHHRLRTSLGAAADGLVRREGDVWSLAPGPDWWVDLLEFRRRAAGDAQDRAAAVRLPSGFLWDGRLPYDDALAQDRAELQATWLRLAAEAVEAGTVPDAEVREQARRLGLAEALADE